ncbi:MAG: S41 family peptidase [Melioribacteraceae bacterium]|nr:S41 family peptidase [Melioribacteraceae bacterium]WKZ68381.1 MAG: S41 family peptidase [Melioribacteraceae bacterium]
MFKKLYINTIIFLILFVQIAAQKQNDIYYDIAKSIDLFGRVYKEITLRYLEEINPREFMLAGIEGMLGTLDPYTVYLDESSQKDIDLMTTGKYGGIGATIGLRNDKIIVVDLIEGYSAQRQGIRIGDEIVRVDSISLNKNNYDQLSLYMKGNPGTSVSVTVLRDGIFGELVFDLIREEVEVKNLTYFGFLPDESNTVFLKLSGFSRTAGEEIKNAILELRNEREIKSIILDLRGNPGGLLDAAISVADKFIKKNQLIVSVVGRDSDAMQQYFAVEEPIAGEADLIVLIDGGSASASEIVAGAIQDHDRGVILGTDSFGKGLVQNVIPLSSETSLKITTGKYLTPSGRSIQKLSYAKENLLASDTTFVIIEEYRTDMNRKVFSGGGIEPDTSVTNDSDSELIQKLIAQGLFFKFATNYFNTNEVISWNELDKEEIFLSFKDYFQSQNINITHNIENQLEQLKQLLEEEKLDGKITQQLSELSKSIKDARISELDTFKYDVLQEIHKEISARIDGREGRIRASLEYDVQLKSAISLLKSNERYQQILALAEEKK